MNLLCAVAQPAQAIVVNNPSLGSIIAIIVAVAGLFFSAFFSGAEIAFFSLSQDDIDSIPDSKRERVQQLLANPEKLLASILIGNNLVNVMIVVVFTFALTQIFTINNPVLNFLLLTVILTFLILLFGEVIPKLYANSNNISFVVKATPLVSSLVSLFSPVSKLLMKSTYVVRKAVSQKADDISVEDLSRALEASDLKSTDEKEMLRGILTFGDKTVSEIMRPRVDVVDLDIELNFTDVVKAVVENGYSRMPVYDQTPDNIKGILYAKDLLPYIGKKDDNFKWQSLMRPAYFVPESRMIDDLLEDFRKKRIHMAVIVDEFGCTQGIATLEDVLEEIVGDIDDEYDTEEKYYTQVAQYAYIFDAKTPLDDFFEATGIPESAFAEHLDDAETLAGLLLALKGDFLKEKEELKTPPCTFNVLKVKKYRIAKVKVDVDPQFLASLSDD
ncbi:MAG: gliding motility-associated protein GldE [Muribaculaceae bacterium]|nr:gliding motility-associated protein GldE [Muribaculaceae bacterium]MBQ4138502.1 gliding motility-associated protein GldE [Muribaculaceae bacterium]